MSFRNFRILIAICLLLTGCAAPAPLICPDGQSMMTSESLYFGTAKPGGTVTAADWQGFLDKTIIPRFPDGLSIWPASGRWKSAAGHIVREDSYVVNIVHPESLAASAALDEIVNKYKTAFQQEAVLRVRGLVCVSF